MSGTRAALEPAKTLRPVPKTMRAGVYREKGIVRVEEVPVPEVGAGEVLIKVHSFDDGIAGQPSLLEGPRCLPSTVPPHRDGARRQAAAGPTADEGWRALLDATLPSRRSIEKRLRTIRSFNGAFIFITQSPRDIIDSGIANALVEQCPTQIHMPNPRATRADYVEGLKRTEAEFDALRRLHKGSGEFLLCQGGESVIAHLPLHGMDEQIAILSGRESTVRLFEAAMREAGNDLDRALQSFHEARMRETTL